MQQKREDPEETKSWEDAKRRSEQQTGQRDEDPTETDEWEQKKRGGTSA